MRALVFSFALFVLAGCSGSQSTPNVSIANGVAMANNVGIPHSKAGSSGCPANEIVRVQLSNTNQTETISYHGGTARLQCMMTVELNGTKLDRSGIAGIDFPDDVPREPLAEAFDAALAFEQCDRDHVASFRASGSLRGMTFINNGYVACVSRRPQIFGGRQQTVTQLVLHGKEASGPVTVSLISFMTQADGSFLPISVQSLTPTRLAPYGDMVLVSGEP